MRFFLMLLFLTKGAGLFVDTGIVLAQMPAGIKHRIVVVDRDGVSIPYVHAVFGNNDRYVLSDKAGVLSFSEEEVAAGGYLVFNSAFYREKRIPVDSLRFIDRVTLESPLLEEVTVYAEGYLEKEMGKVARYFREHYARDYMSTITTLYTVECNGKYREFMGYHGVFGSFGFTQKAPEIYFNDRNGMCGIEPLTTMRSDRLRAESDEILEPESVFSNQANFWTPGSLKINYYDTRSDVGPLFAKRGFEIYSPLNEKRIKYYDYWKQAGYSSAEGEVVVIKFRTKVGAFPKKTRLYGEGEIHYLKDSYRVTRVVTENMQDLYSITPRWGIKEFLPSATAYAFTVHYGQCEGKLYTESVERSVTWMELNFSEGNFYRVTLQPRRNPGKYHTKEYFYARFSNIVFSGEKWKMLKKMMSNRFADIPYFYASFEKEWWDRQPMPGIDKERLFRDLNVNGRNLYQQAEENGLKLTNEHQRLGYRETSRMRYRQIRDIIYLYIYEKKFK